MVFVMEFKSTFHRHEIQCSAIFRTNVLSENNFIAIVVEDEEVTHEVLSIFKRRFYLSFVPDRFPKPIYVLHINVDASRKNCFGKELFLVVGVFAILGLILWQHKHDSNIFSRQVNEIRKVAAALKP